jgi:uracil phosphoribosyltransferase
LAVNRNHDHENFFLTEHPLINHKLFHLRNSETSKRTFKDLVREIALLLAYEATADLPLSRAKVSTPLETTEDFVLEGKKPVILPILRAGLGMVDGFLDLLPSARVGHVGIFRDETTLQPKHYYFKIPNESEKRIFFVVDPMLATGGSAVAACDMLKERGVRHIKFICLVAAPEGVLRMAQSHPDVPIYAAALDRKLNDKGYILPGLGDAGDRLFGTR